MASNSTHTVRIEGDFSSLSRQIIKFGDQSGDVMGKATSAGVQTHLIAAYRKATRAHVKLSEDSEKQISALRFAYAAKNSKKEDKLLGLLARQIAQREADLQDKNLKEDVRAKKKADQDRDKRNLAALQKLKKEGGPGYEAEGQSLVEGLKEALNLQKKLAKSVEKSTNQIARGEERSAKFLKIFRRDAERGVDDITEGLGGAMESFKDGLKDIDIGSALSSGGKGLGKGLGSASEMLSGMATKMGGSMGALTGALAGVLAVVGPLVMAFGLFAGVMMGIDKETKDFNKSAINTFGTRSVMNIGVGDMRENLRTLQHVTMDLNKTLGLTSEEAMGVFDALDSGGITMQRLTQGAVNAADKEQALSDTLISVTANAKALGVSVNEFAGTLAEYTDTLGFSLSNVSDQFANISAQAADAGFSTRRFYSLITQASSGQASLNTHLDVTSELMVRMGKILGAKKAAEMLGESGGAFKNMGTQERYKFMMTSGKKNVRKSLTDDATRQASSFVGDMKSTTGTSKTALDAAIAEAAAAGVALSQEARDDATGRTMVKEMAKLSRDQQATLSRALTSSSDSTVQGLGRGIDQLITVSRGTSGRDADMADAMSGVSPGGAIEMKLNQVKALFGKSINELSGVERMAAESITGMSGEQLEQYQAIARASEGSLTLLQASAKRQKEHPMTKDELKALQKDQDKRFGGHITENGEVVTEGNQAVKSATDLLNTRVARGDTEQKSAAEKNLELGYKAFDETVTISDILGNEISKWLRGIYEDFGLPMIDMMGDLLEKLMVSGRSSDQRKADREFRDTLVKELSKAQKQKTEADRTIASLGTKEHRTPEENERLFAAQRAQGAASSTISATQNALSEASAGRHFALDVTGRTYTVAGVEYPDRVSATKALKEKNDALAQEARDNGVTGQELADSEYYRPLELQYSQGDVNGTSAALQIANNAAVTGDTRAANQFRGQYAPGGSSPSWNMVGDVGTAPNAGTHPGIMLSNPGAPVSTGASRPAAPPVAPARVAAPAPAPATGSGAAADAADAAAQVTDPIAAAVETGATTASVDQAKARNAIAAAARETNKNFTKVLTKGTKLGDALARSDLPDAIVAAQVKQQIASLAFAAGLTADETGAAVQEYMEKGTLSDTLQEAIKGGSVTNADGSITPFAEAYRGALGDLGVGGGGENPLNRRARFSASLEEAEVEDPANDFIYRGDGVRGNITPISTEDQFVGMKPGGPVDRAMKGGGGGGGGGNVTINIYGGDERKVFDVVKRVLTQSGIGPGRVAARA